MRDFSDSEKDGLVDDANIFDIERKKEYLRSYQRAVRREQDALERIQFLRTSAMFPSLSGFDGMPASPNKRSGLAEYAERIDAALSRLKDVQAEKMRLYWEIEYRLRRMKDGNQREVLRLRYLKGLEWTAICEEMGYSWKQIFRIHQAALGEFGL